MRVIITGGAGYLGQCLARGILRRGVLRSHKPSGEELTKVSSIVLADRAAPARWHHEEVKAKTKLMIGDVGDAAFVDGLLADATDVSIFHMGAVMSGDGERDFDGCMRTNLHGTINVLEAARRAPGRPKVVYASAGATLGAGAPTDWVSSQDVVGDFSRATPHTTYGATKACGELLLADYSRRGFLDGRGLRLPTICVRAGVPNAATTGCFSGVVRETLAGRDTVLPIAPDVVHAVAGAKNCVDGLLDLHDAPNADDVLGFDRTVFLPACPVTLDELHVATVAACAPEDRKKLGRVSYAIDEGLSAAVGSFPSRIDSTRAEALGIAPAAAPAALVREYCEAFPGDLAVGVNADETAVADDDDDDVAVAVVTGGGSGIGRAVAIRLARGGWAGGRRVRVVIAGRRAKALEETKAMCGPDADVVCVPTDVTRERDVTRLFARSKRCDLLFNNAGVNVGPTSVEAMSLHDWRWVVGTNLDAAFHVAREAFKLMATHGGGRIVNNGSVSAAAPRPGSVAYTASKHAVTGLTKSLALDGRPFDIAAGQIDFGNVVSAISDGMATGMPQADGSVRPEARMEASDAADAVFYMASLPLSANVLQMTVMASKMPLVGRG